MSSKILITGGHGFLGMQVLNSLLKDGFTLDSRGERQSIEHITVTDIAPCENAHAQSLLEDSRVSSVVANIADTDAIAGLLDKQPDAIIHLAAVVSGQAEQDFDLGMKVNFQATAELLAQCRHLQKPPAFVFASSYAVYGGTMPRILTDDTLALPQGSYGAQKLMSEALLTDYTRKGFIFGHSLRLPTVAVRPGKPNAAASSFASGIIREPLHGQQSVCPVPADTAMLLTSPSCVVQNLIHALSVPTQPDTQTIALPGLTATVTEMLDALRDISGEEVVNRVTFKRDDTICRLVETWPARSEATRALGLGFAKPVSMHAIIEEYCAEHVA